MTTAAPFHIVCCYYAVVDPCEDARKDSMRCLDKNNYDRDACTDFFKSYRECKKKWLDQRRQDRRDGREA